MSTTKKNNNVNQIVNDFNNIYDAYKIISISQCNRIHILRYLIPYAFSRIKFFYVFCILEDVSAHRNSLSNTNGEKFVLHK